VLWMEAELLIALQKAILSKRLLSAKQLKREWPARACSFYGGQHPNNYTI
jgi:hypothetical protein